MNETMKKMMVALMAGLALCTAAPAAPRGQDRKGPASKAPAHQVASAKPKAKPAPAHQVASAKPKAKPAPARQVARHDAKPRHEAKPQYAARPRHDAPPPRPAERPHHGHDEHRHNGTLHTEDWCALGASLVGGLLGAAL